MQRIAPKFEECGCKDLMASRCKFARFIVNSCKHMLMLFLADCWVRDENGIHQLPYLWF